MYYYYVYISNINVIDMQVKQNYNQKDLPYSPVGIILPPRIPTFKVMPDAPDGRWLNDWEIDQEYLKELMEGK